MTDNWPWDQPPNCAVLTVRSITSDAAPILYVSHDLDDHGWQFLGSGDVEMKDAMLVALSNIVKRDPTVEQVADLPPGWYAWRNTVSDPWQRAPKSEQE